jgi:hypothetical protein
MALTYLQLLGEAQAEVGLRSFPVLADQRYQLLAYLAYCGIRSFSTDGPARPVRLPHQEVRGCRKS